MIRLIDINKDNEQAVLQLQVKAEQIHFIESVQQCLDEAKVDSRWLPLGILDDECFIGFAMMGEFLYPDGMRTWMDRILIDQAYQGKGYGKKALIEVLVKCYEAYHHDLIYLSVVEGNQVAYDLYSKMGFIENGEIDDHGEKVMVYHYKK